MSRRRFFGGENEEATRQPSYATLAQGLLPSLSFVIRGLLSEDTDVCDTEPDTYPPKINSRDDIDPYGSWYYCVICKCELADLYYSCDGCENVMRREYNLCSDCHNANRSRPYAIPGHFDDGVDQSNLTFSSLKHHFPMKRFKNYALKKCKNSCANKAMVCERCASFLHTKFTKRRRFHKECHLKGILGNCGDLVGTNEVPFSSETRRRLERKKMILDDVMRVPQPYYPSIPTFD